MTDVVFDPAARAPRFTPLRSARLHRSGLPNAWGALFTAVVLAGAWWWLAPPQLGGSTTLVVVDGSSMAPNFHRSDLVALRPSSTYQVGDIVGYRSTLLHRIVLHRIVAVQRGRLILKGDDNAFRDPELVPRNRVVGKLRVHLRGVGQATQILTRPWAAAALVALLVILAGTGPRGVRHARPSP